MHPVCGGAGALRGRARHETSTGRRPADEASRDLKATMPIECVDDSPGRASAAGRRRRRLRMTSMAVYPVRGRSCLQRQAAASGVSRVRPGEGDLITATGQVGPDGTFQPQDRRQGDARAPPPSTGSGSSPTRVRLRHTGPVRPSEAWSTAATSVRREVSSTKRRSGLTAVVKAAERARAVHACPDDGRAFNRILRTTRMRRRIAGA